MSCRVLSLFWLNHSISIRTLIYRSFWVSNAILILFCIAIVLICKFPSSVISWSCGSVINIFTNYFVSLFVSIHILFQISTSLDRRTPKSEVTAFLWFNSLSLSVEAVLVKLILFWVCFLVGLIVIFVTNLSSGHEFVIVLIFEMILISWNTNNAIITSKTITMNWMITIIRVISHV